MLLAKLVIKNKNIFEPKITVIYSVAGVVTVFIVVVVVVVIVINLFDFSLILLFFFFCQGHYKDVVEFQMASRNACKSFWKIAITTHAFFR